MKRFYLLKIFLIACILGIYGGGSAVAQDATVEFSSGLPTSWKKIGTGTIAKQTYSSKSCLQLQKTAKIETPVYTDAYNKMVVNVARSGGGTNFTVSYQIDDANEVEITTLKLSASGTWENKEIEIPVEAQVPNVKFLFYSPTSSYYISKIDFYIASTLPSPELSFGETIKFIINKGETFTAPILINANDVEVTYSSSNEAVATVDAEGNVTPTGAIGKTTIKANFAGNDNYKSEDVEYTLIVKANNLKELVEQIRTDNVTSSSSAKEYIVELNNVIVTGVSGNYAYIQDAETGIAFYKYGHNLVAGNIYTGTATVNAYMNNNNPRITEFSGVESIEGTVSEPIEVTISDLNNDATYTYFGRRVIIKNATVVTDFTSGASISQDGNTITVYDQSTEELALTVGTGVDIIGYLGAYKEALQFNVLTQDDITVVSGKVNPVFEYNVTTVTAFIGDEFTAPILSNESDGIVTYKSSNNEVATISEDGIVTINGVGTTEITASVTETTTNLAATAKYTLIVKSMEGLTKFTLVTSTDDLVVGARYIITCSTEGFIMGAQDNTNYRSDVKYTGFPTDVVRVDESTVSVVTLGGEAGAYTFYDAVKGGYLSSGTTSSNYLKTNSTITNNSKADIEFDNNNAIITFNAGERNVIRYNPTDERFSCYKSTSTMKLVQLYRCDIGTLNIPSVEGYGTFFTDKAFVMPEGVQGSLVTNAVEGKLTLGWEYQEGATVPANTALLLKGAQGDYTYAVTSTTEVAPAENMLKGSMDNSLTEGNAGDKFYKLSYNKDEKIGFFWGGDNGAAFENKAGKAYLVISQALASKVSGFILDDNEVTGITSVGVQQNDGAIYNMQGVRVQNANRKGIYIINGKKVIK